MASVFFSYSHADEALRDQLEKQLSMLKRQGVIETWHDRRIGAGQEFGREIDSHVEDDDIILLLVSPDFLDSDYCYEKEMLRAVERHEAGDAIVIPVILRACDWHHAPFGKLLAAPTDGKPIMQLADRDQAMLEVARAVRAAAERLAPEQAAPRPAPQVMPSASEVPTNPIVRSSNLRLAKQFTEQDKDKFQVDTFEFLAQFFENSLGELADRNSGIEGTFRRIDANRFTGKIYKGGQAVAGCTIFMGGHFMSGIAYSSSSDARSGSFNENLTVEADDQMLYLRSMGMSFRQRSDSEKLTQEGAAELYWAMFIEPLQRG